MVSTDILFSSGLSGRYSSGTSTPGSISGLSGRYSSGTSTPGSISGLSGRYSSGTSTPGSIFDYNIVLTISGSTFSICVLSQGMCNKASTSLFSFPLL